MGWLCLLKVLPAERKVRKIIFINSHSIIEFVRTPMFYLVYRYFRSPSSSGASFHALGWWTFNLFGQNSNSFESLHYQLENGFMDTYSTKAICCDNDHHCYCARTSQIMFHFCSTARECVFGARQFWCVWLENATNSRIDRKSWYWIIDAGWRGPNSLFISFCVFFTSSGIGCFRAQIACCSICRLSIVTSHLFCVPIDSETLNSARGAVNVVVSPMISTRDKDIVALDLNFCYQRHSFTPWLSRY